MKFLHQLTSICPDLMTRMSAAVDLALPSGATLTVENIGLGPKHLPALSICAYRKEDSEVLREPEMCFEMDIKDGRVTAFHPYYFRITATGVQQIAYDEHTGQMDLVAVQSQQKFATRWSAELLRQRLLQQLV